jgi:hypothetical protein
VQVLAGTVSVNVENGSLQALLKGSQIGSKSSCERDFSLVFLSRVLEVTFTI